jgi:glycerate-2-kinase
VNLKSIYLAALEGCAPGTLVREHVTRDMPRNVVAIGKCAGALLDGVAGVHEIESALVAIPEGYRLPDAFGGRSGRRSTVPVEIHVGGHPHMTAASFAAGRALLDYVDAHDDILFLISGGGSACVEVPLPPHSEEEVARMNAELIASGRPIAEINAERTKRSAIKGGRLRERVRGRAVTLVYSDVATGALQDVASGPTIARAGEAILVADNATLVRAAAKTIGDNAVVVDEQLEGGVLDSAALLAARAGALRSGEVLAAGGEPTVLVRGKGRGGRCSELAVRFAALSEYEALFASSDGIDGNSGVAGWYLPPRRGLELPAGWEAALADSDSMRIAAQVGEPITIAPTGNNLRDLFLVTRR